MATVGGQRSSVVSRSAAALLFVSLMSAVQPSATTDEVKGMKLALTEDGELFDLWKNSPSSLLMFYFFNITNPREVQMGEKPRVTELGPYAYRVHRQKENITFLENDAKVAAITTETFVFVSEKSVGDPNVDLITTVNIPAVMTELKSYSFFMRTFISMWMNSQALGLFTTRPVGELLWGYRDQLLQKLRSLKPDEPSEYFGLLLGRNGSHSGEYVYLTGETDYRDYARIDTWKGQSSSIRGTDGRVFHPNLTKEERVDVFVPAMERSVSLEFERTEEVRGIPAYRFTLPGPVLTSAVNPESDDLRVTSCHTLSTCDAVDGLSSRKDLHQMFVDINPATGVVLRASRTLQWNVILKKIPGFPYTRLLNTTAVPIAYYKEVEEIDSGTEAKLKQLLQATK